VRVAFFVSFVGPSLVLQDLQDEAMMGFGGDEDGGQLQGLCRLRLAGCLFALVLSDASQLRLGRGGLRWLRRWVGVTVVAPSGVQWWWW